VDTDGDGNESSSDEFDQAPVEAFSSLPTSAYVSKLLFANRKTLCAGKYGAPSDDALWKWYVPHTPSHTHMALCHFDVGARRDHVARISQCHAIKWAKQEDDIWSTVFTRALLAKLLDLAILGMWTMAIA
jgi:hypothetical protein